MTHVLLITSQSTENDLLKNILSIDQFEPLALINVDKDPEMTRIAKHHQITLDFNWRKWLKHVAIVFDLTGNHYIYQQLLSEKKHETILLPISSNAPTNKQVQDKKLLSQIKIQNDNLELLFNHIRDGMIVIDNNENIQYLNKRAEMIIDCSKDDFLGKNIKTLISNTRLPRVLRSRQKEINKKHDIGNNKQIVTSRIPIIDMNQQLVGAIAVFKDITEVVELAEENTDLKDIKIMLEAIIQSSNDAISVVDENGLGLMINPAYTRLTGLTKKEIVGKPAHVDISEGESMHMQVLNTRRSVRGVKMKVGPNHKEVLVNAAPIIVSGKIKGSVAVLHDVTEIRQLTNELKKAKRIIRNLEATHTFDDIIGHSPEMKVALEQAKVGAKTPATVLLRGESGTGKELFAHAIHNESDRKYNKFIRVNCAAIAESVLESELFGYEEGAFSGAKSGGKKGLFEEANMGSIFLDEIGELSLAMQAKLLRVLQENEIVRVGGTTPIKLNIRIITATNVNLEKAIMNGKFREDLYYRLNRLPIFIPSLRERLGDLPYLVAHLIEKLNRDYSRSVQTISEEALNKLKRYEWPGNVRELENILGRAMIFMENHERIIHTKHLPEIKSTQVISKQTETKRIDTYDSLQNALEKYEKDYISQIYSKNQYNKTNTAKELNISIRNLYYKIEKYRLDK